MDAVADAGVELVALTDHDSTAGLARAAQRAHERGLSFVSGIEMTTYSGDEVVHVLGYAFDPADAMLQTTSAVAQQVWGGNQRRWVAALHEQGNDVVYDRDFADGPVRLPVLIERLCRSGIAQGDPADCLALFRSFFAALPSSAYERLPTPAQAADVLRGASGISFLAHPYSLKKPGAVDEWLAACDGLEALYGRYGAAERQALLEKCIRAGKLAAAGSDYHGYFEDGYVNHKLVLPKESVDRLTVER